MPGWHSALFCYWVPNTFFTLMTNTLHIPAIGKVFGVPQKPPKSRTELEDQANDPIQRLIQDSKAEELDAASQKEGISKYLNRVKNYLNDLTSRILGKDSSFNKLEENDKKKDKVV
eukprot:CAMPEP_0117428172 /NCGR_PEP_ID=MMETSP0758-20121206/7946_1 /TAXON_ID=63605 /ORGANISM="Percolomonas cosmopolitus, Strain AE-1 (ATCC 50343)" /LENGTH=115 /DNA_ID=CAMNT_0005214395 /DNA_START=421 /DNA_END=765 /DNA_ORIENTATION=+